MRTATISKFLILILLSSQASAQAIMGAQKQGQSVNISSQYTETKQHPVAGARAYIPTPTSDCMGSSGIGGQGQFFGFSFSSTTQSKPCNIREDAKIAMWVLGDEDLAREIFMQGDYAKATRPKYTKSEVCIYPTDECKQSKRFKW